MIATDAPAGGFFDLGVPGQQGAMSWSSNGLWRVQRASMIPQYCLTALALPDSLADGDVSARLDSSKIRPQSAMAGRSESHQETI